MKRLFAVLLLLLGVFYVAWPAYSGYRLKTALDAGDPAGLEARVDFPSVRESMRPAVSERAEAAMRSALDRAGPSGTALAETMKTQLLPKVVDRALDTLVTPQSLIRMHAQGKSLKDGLEAIVKDNPDLIGSLSGLFSRSPSAGVDQAGKQKALDTLRDIAGQFGFGKSSAEAQAVPPEAAAQAPAGASVAAREERTAAKPKYGVENIKSIRFDGPLRMTIGLAKDAAARDPDLDVTLAFQNGDWQLAGLVPKF